MSRCTIAMWLGLVAAGLAEPIGVLAAHLPDEGKYEDLVVPSGPVAQRAGVIHRVEQKLRLDYSPESAHDDSLISAKAKTKDALAKLVSAAASAPRQRPGTSRR